MAKLMLLIPIFIAFTASLSSSAAAENDNIIVTTNLGKIQGTKLKTTSGKDFYAFRGVRYAKPPIGPLRFKAPEPVDAWKDVFDATTDGPMCPQPSRNSSLVSEDCLRINVYTHSNLSETVPNSKKSVIVYFHPGGFYSNSAQSFNYAGPYYFMDRDIVLVTINYRLGSLGFLATGTPEAPGNAGLKDQVMALKWIQSHIHHFGGDANSVTLLGYSAGAMSITLHMVSPMSRNLFHKAIVMSGSAVAQWEIPTNQIDLAERQARLFNCTDDKVDKMVDCLMKIDAMEIGNSLRDMFEFAGGQPIILFKPVVEADFGQERFLIEDPLKSYLSGNFSKIPIIAGITKDEFAGPAIWILKDDQLRNDLNSEFNKWAPINFLYERNSKRSEEITKKLRKFYLNDEALNLNRSLVGLNQLFADSVIGFGMHRFVDLVAEHTELYQYCFSYKGRYSHTYYPDDKTPYGVVHHDDLLYLFTVNPNFVPVFTDKDPEQTTVQRLTRMWVNFAKAGNPVDSKDEYLTNVSWHPFNSKQKEYLDIGEDLVEKSHLYNERYSEWDKLFPLR